MSTLMHLTAAAIFFTTAMPLTSTGDTSLVTTRAANVSNKCSPRDPSLTSASSTPCVSFNFRFLELDQYTYNTSVLKHVEVFMDERDFKEDNLKQMLEYLSSKHVSFPRLVVVVHTNWNQLGTFFSSDCPGIGVSNQPDPPDKYDYFQAVMYRYKQNQFFHYYPKLKSEERKTVVAKGKDCWVDCE